MTYTKQGSIRGRLAAFLVALFTVVCGAFAAEAQPTGRIVVTPPHGVVHVTPPHAVVRVVTPRPHVKVRRTVRHSPRRHFRLGHPVKHVQRPRILVRRHRRHGHGHGHR